jgi:lysophospholipase L1-like esterase
MARIVMVVNWRTFVGRLLLVLASALVGLVAAEVGLRVWTGLTLRSGPGPEDGLERSAATSPDPDADTTSLRGLVRASSSPDLVYELKADLDCRFKGVRVRTNSHGMRGREFSAAKAADVIRIAGLGDSVMFGWGVAEEDTYLRVLGQRLGPAASGGRQVEVLNFAVPGYNTAMEVAAFRDKVLDFSPDLVVIHFVHNDLGLPQFMIEAPNPWSLRQLWLVDLIRNGWRGVQRRGRQWHQSRELEHLSAEDRRRVQDAYAHLAGPEAFRAAMASLAQLAEADSIPVVLVLLQTDGEPYAEASATADRYGFLEVVAGPFFTDYIHDHDIEPTRDGWADTFWLSRKDQHPNELGHRLFADAIFEAVRPLVYRDGSR